MEISLVLWNQANPDLHPKVIDLAAFRGEVVIGYIFGGLFSDSDNNGNTGASGRIFEVKLTPNNTPDAPLSFTRTPNLALAWKTEEGELMEWSKVTVSSTVCLIL